MRILPCLAALVACTPAAPPPPPGLFVHGEVWAGDDVPTGRPGWVHVTADALRLVDAAPPGAQTVQVDRITAGFVDAHAHPVGLGRKLDELNVQDLPTFAATLDAVAARARVGEGWIVGRGWDQNDWADAPPGGWPSAADFDAITGGRPTLLHRVDGHASWANTAALEAAGITAETPDPPGGRILRDAAGAPTGVLIDTASDLIPVPPPTVPQIAGWLRRAQDAMLAVGLVGAHDMGVNDAMLAAYRTLNAEGALRVRVWVYLDPTSEAAAALLRDGPLDEGNLRIVGIKAYADGALGSRGALLLAPYHDEPATSGLRLTSREQLDALAVGCLRARAQLAVHAIGDAAARDVLDAFAAARAAVPEAAGVPLRLEHAQVVAAEDRARLAALHVIASVQPTHATSDRPWAEDRLGPSRIADSYAWRSLAAAGAKLALGSDFPVESEDPLWGLWAATTRTDAAGQPPGGWRVDEALTEPEAIAGFTSWAGRAVLEDPPRCVGDGCTPELSMWQRADGPPGWTSVGVILGGERLGGYGPAR